MVPKRRTTIWGKLSDLDISSENQMLLPDIDNSSNEKVDSGFAGAGEYSNSTIFLTTTHIAVITILCLDILLDIMYLIMSFMILSDQNLVQNDGLNFLILKLLKYYNIYLYKVI